MYLLKSYNNFIKESIGYITHEDYEKEMYIFRKNPKYGEWDMMNGRVDTTDNPYYLLMVNNGFQEGDEVIFYAERDRKGKLEKNTDGTFSVRDENKNKWGVGGILHAPGGYIVKKPSELRK
jgi:hypothetical protein